MQSPTLWAGVPFGNSTALTDLSGTIELTLHAYADAIFALTGETVGVPPLGHGAGSKAWLLALQRTYEEMSAALGLGAPGDLASFNLSERKEWPGWTFTLSQETERLRVAAGLS